MEPHVCTCVTHTDDAGGKTHMFLETEVLQRGGEESDHSFELGLGNSEEEVVERHSERSSERLMH